MSNKGSSKTPSPPDPWQTASAQSAANEQIARLQTNLNRPNIFTPYGSSTWYYGAGDRWTQKQELTPVGQQLFDQQNQISGKLGALGLGQLDRVQQTLATPFNYDGIANAPGSQDFGAEREQVIRRLYNEGLRQLTPEFDKQIEGLEQNLANRGITPGTPLYNRLKQEAERGQHRAKVDLLTQATVQGGQEQNRLYGLAQGARQQAIAEREKQRAQPLQESLALFTGASPVSQISFPTPGPGSVGPVDITGLVQTNYQNQLARQSQNQANQGALLGGLAGIAGTVGSWF